MSPRPRISVVVPSYNQGRFVAATLESLFSQGYPGLEVIFLDAGSTDETAEAIAPYCDRFTFWRSGPDRGQAAAINEGLARATGDILCWLNSDDLHFPDSLQTVAERLGPHCGTPAVLYGSCEVFRDGTAWREVRPAVPFSRARLQITDFIDQPSSFWTREAWEAAGPLDEGLWYAFDWDWFLRAASVCRFLPCDQLLSRYRVHPSHKSKTGGDRRWQELLEVVRRHAPDDVQKHYEHLSRHRLTRAVLNGRMRAALTLRRLFPPSTSDLFATALLPPFWFLPRGIHRGVLWEISGIR